MIHKISVWLLFAVAVTIVPLSAFTYVHVSDPSLVVQADLIVRVEAMDLATDVSGGTIWTLHTMWVEDVVKGEVDGAYVTVRVPGGSSKTLGVEVSYDGAPSFSPGEKALLFLRESDDGTHSVLHFALGAFRERRVQGATVFVRPFPEPEETGERPIEVARDAERFVEWLRDETAGRHRERDYLVGLSLADRPETGPKFTVFEKFQAWKEFQNKPIERVTWKRHGSGQRGVPGKGTRELKRVFKVLSGTPDSRGRKDKLLSVALRGKVNQVPDERCNGSNLVFFDDIVGIIEDNFHCTRGGVLAVGGSCRRNEPDREWKGRPVRSSSSARVVHNKNTECYYTGESRWTRDTASNKFAEVTTHEVLHTLGLVHSCGDDTSPRCNTSDVLDDATMRSSAHADGRGAAVREDDLAGLWFLYDPNFFAAPCHLPPGHKNFCKVCGPCGEGQGQCKKSSQCFDGFRCRQDLEAGFKTCQ